MSEDTTVTSVAIAGRRCQITKAVDSTLGRIEHFAEGRVRYVSENLGRLLFFVEWERGGSSVVFPEEISLLDDEAPIGLEDRG